MLVWKRTVSIFNTEYELQEKHSLFLPFFNLSCRILPQNDIQRPVFIIQNELTSFQNGCIIEIDGTEVQALVLALVLVQSAVLFL